MAHCVISAIVDTDVDYALVPGVHGPHLPRAVHARRRAREPGPAPRLQLARSARTRSACGRSAPTGSAR